MMKEVARYRHASVIRHGRMALLAFVGGLLYAATATAQTDDPAGIPVPGDTTRTVGADTLAPLTGADTIPSFEPFAPPLGSFRVERGAEFADLTKSDFPFSHYFSLFEPLRTSIPAYPLSLGSPGHLRTFGYAGADPRALAVSFNGRPLSGAEGGIYDPEFYSPEFVERGEVLRGAAAAVYGDASALLGLNLLQPRFNVAGSYLRLAFSQGGGNTTNADLSYSRNVAERTNLTVGVRRVSSEGIFDNQGVSFWGVRGALTVRPVDGLTLSFTEMFTDMSRGLNGGLTAAAGIDDLNPDVVNDTLSETHLRHDMTLAAQWYPSMPEGGITDSIDLSALARVDGALYFTHADRGLRVGDDRAEIAGVKSRYRDDVIGTRAAAYIPLGPLAFHWNLAGELTDGKAGKIHLGGMAEIPLGERVRLFGGGAVSEIQEVTTLSLFGEGRANPVDSLDLRLTFRTFSDNAPAGIPNTGSYTVERSRLLLEAEGTWRQGEAALTFGGFMRRVAAVQAGREDYTITGANVSGRILIAFLVLEPELLLTAAPEGDKRFPLLQGGGNLYAPLRLFQGNLIAQVGASLEYRTPFAGSEYDEVRELWLYPSDPAREETLFPVLDLYARGRIGSAYLKLTMSNLLDVEYYSVYRYPVWGRTFQLGITWTMID